MGAVLTGRLAQIFEEILSLLQIPSSKHPGGSLDQFIRNCDPSTDFRCRPAKQALLGEMYFHGQGVERDEERKSRVQIRKADLAIGRGGVSSEETTTAAPITIDEADIELPDFC